MNPKVFDHFYMAEKSGYGMSWGKPSGSEPVSGMVDITLKRSMMLPRWFFNNSWIMTRFLDVVYKL